MKLSEHFSLQEFTRSYTAIRNRIDNTPSQEVIENLRLLCIHVLEPIRKHYGPVTVNSGYRCPALNTLVKGARKSNHLYGYAADVEVRGVPNLELSAWIQKNIPHFTTLIEEYCDLADPEAGWIHVDYVTGKLHKRVLTVS